MAKCEYCGDTINELPRPCSYCGHYFCTHHRLPESHDCKGIKKGNIFRGSKTSEDTYTQPKHHHKSKPHKRKKHYHEVQEHHKREYVGTSRQKPNYIEKVKSFFKRRYYKTKSWLNSRHHRSYRNWNAFFMNILWIVVLSISFMIIYSNLEKLNEIVLWFLPLGGALLLVNAFFWIKYSWKLLKRIFYWYEGERNWVKYLTILIIILLLWQGYQNRDTIFDGVIEHYDKINFSSILPINFGNFSLDSETLTESSNTDDSRPNYGNWGCSVIQIEYNYRSTEKDSRQAIDYLNKIRKQNGKNEISFDKRVFELALARAKDMREHNYLDHTNPYTGTCPDNLKDNFGIKSYEYVAENAFGNPQYSEGSCTEIEFKSMTEPIDDWMTSRGHRYNLLYDDHISGAVACYKNMCAFLGLNRDRFGEGCHTAEEGIAHWESVGKQPGEI